MSLDELYTILIGTNLPVVYRAWPEGKAPPLPWICYHTPGENPFGADGVVYYAGTRVNVELYTAKKDPATEAVVDAALTAAGIFYEKSEEYLDSEKCYQILYEIEV